MSTRCRRTQFRPCIDLHQGQVKQIVGGSMRDDVPEAVQTNFTSTKPSEYYAELYRKYDLQGGHVIKLGEGNDEAAKAALVVWPNGLHLGGGVTIDNAQNWIETGAEKVIVTSWIFPKGRFSLQRLQELSKRVGQERLVVDLSCRKQGENWVVAMNRWQSLTDMRLGPETLNLLSEFCSEFLVHAADVEGLCCGIDQELVKCLGEWTTTPCVYAGGANTIKDLELVDRLSNGKVDLTFGSALDIFGGNTVKFEDCVAWNQACTRQNNLMH